MPRQSKPCNRGLVGLIGQQEKKLNNLYNSTAREISVILTKYKLKSKRDVWLGNANAKKEVDAAMNRFQSKLFGSIKGDMGSSWAMADDCADGVVNDYLKNINIPEDVRNAMLYQNASAFDAFVNRRRNGLNLSDRVWKITKDTKKQFEQLLSSGVMDGRSAQGMATDLRRYLKEPNKQFRRVRNEAGKLVLSNPAKDYHPGQGVYRSSYQNAFRLARNEVNLSYRHNEHLRRQNMPFVTGIRVNLSGSHPTRDICDDMQGDYPKTFRFGGWHPTCICFTTSILLDKKEFVEYAKTGKIDASRNITKIPDNASKYLKENADTFANYKNPPYFLKDNFDFKNGDYTFHNRNQIILDAKNAGIDTEKVFMRDGVYTPERQILHDDIIQKFMSESKVRGTNQKYMLGGAPANGKSALVDSGFLPHPKGILTVDSDAIKGLIPEYQTMLANGDSAAAAFVHEESSYLAKRILAQAEKLGDDFVLDGVNDGSIEKLLKKIEGYKKGGSKIRADYVSLDTKLSKKLALDRYEKTGRYVPDEIVAGNNIEVSKLVPEILNRNAIDEFYLWDTNIKDKARLILKQIDGKFEMVDEKLYKRFLRKAGNNHMKKVLADNRAIADLLKKAENSADELQGLAVKLAKQNGAYTTPINLKTRKSILRKCIDELEFKNLGELDKSLAEIQDAVRTTIIADKNKIEEILAIMEKNRKLNGLTRIKRQLPEKFMGYSGNITNFRTKQGILGEIQVNTERMIFAKEEPSIGKAILGEKRWNEIRREIGQPGGLGHKYYEEYRKLKPEIPEQAKRMRELEKLSREYYKHFQE